MLFATLGAYAAYACQLMMWYNPLKKKKKAKLKYVSLGRRGFYQHEPSYRIFMSTNKRVDLRKLRCETAKATEYLPSKN